HQWCGLHYCGHGLYRHSFGLGELGERLWTVSLYAADDPCADVCVSRYDPRGDLADCPHYGRGSADDPAGRIRPDLVRNLSNYTGRDVANNSAGGFQPLCSTEYERSRQSAYRARSFSILPPSVPRLGDYRGFPADRSVASTTLLWISVYLPISIIRQSRYFNLEGDPIYEFLQQEPAGRHCVGHRPRYSSSAECLAPAFSLSRRQPPRTGLGPVCPPRRGRHRRQD